MAKQAAKLNDSAHAKALRMAVESGSLQASEACRVLRALEGFSQDEMAALVGVNVKVIKSLESAKGNPGFKSLEKIANAFGLEIAFVKPRVSVGLMDPKARLAEERQIRLAEGAAIAASQVSAEDLNRRNGLKAGKARYKLPSFA